MPSDSARRQILSPLPPHPFAIVYRFNRRHFGKLVDERFISDSGQYIRPMHDVRRQPQRRVSSGKLILILNVSVQLIACSRRWNFPGVERPAFRPRREPNETSLQACCAGRTSTPLSSLLHSLSRFTFSNDGTRDRSSVRPFSVCLLYP